MNVFHLLILAILAVPVFLVWYFLIKPQRDASKQRSRGEQGETRKLNSDKQ